MQPSQIELGQSPALFIHVVDNNSLLTPIQTKDIRHVLAAQRTFGKSIANGAFAAVTAFIIIAYFLYSIELVLDYSDIFTLNFLWYAGLNTAFFVVILALLIVSHGSHTRATKHYAVLAMLSGVLAVLTWEIYIIVGGGPDVRLKNYLLLVTSTVFAEFILLFSFFLKAIAVV